MHCLVLPLPFVSRDPHGSEGRTMISMIISGFSGYSILLILSDAFCGGGGLYENVACPT